VAIDAGNYVTYADAGRRLGVSRSAVWKAVKRGQLATVEVDGRRYVAMASLRQRMSEPVDVVGRRNWRLRRGR
jgi:biotin operon repressor